MKNTGKTYDNLTDAANANSRIVCLREMHGEIDAAIMYAYRWDDLNLGYGYQEQPNLAENDRVSFTISEVARAEMLRRFAELNRQRYEERHAAAPAANPRAWKGHAKATPARQAARALVDAPDGTSKTSKTKPAAPAKKVSTRRPR